MYINVSRKIKLSAVQILAIGFLSLIIIGGIILSLPISSASGTGTNIIDGFFTSTSAVCVTGLITLDTATHWNYFGKTVIIILIQIGGLGFMSFTTLFALILKKKIRLRERLVLQEAMNTFGIQGLVRLMRYILIFTFSIEFMGALLYATQFVPQFGVLKGIYYSVFASISAFCNAGFDLMGPIAGKFSSLTSFVDNSLINFVICGLIILGGIGFPVLLDVINNRKYSKLNIHSKIVINTTGILIAIGIFFIFINEFNNKGTLGNLNTKEKVLSSIFQSVTLRTAGYNTIDLTLLSESTLFFMVILMLIGASPASTGGGIKTTTIATLFLTVKAFIFEKGDIEVYQRRISDSTVKKSLGLFFIGVFTVLFGILILSIVNPGFTLLESTFEVVSAFATVGLSIGGTPELTSAGKIIIMILMFLGRVGSLTIFVALLSKNSKIKPKIRYPEGKIIVG